MKIETAVAHYGDVHALATALNLRTQNIYSWKTTHGGLVPLRHAYFLSELTGGKLAVEPDDYLTPTQRKLLKARGKK